MEGLNSLGRLGENVLKVSLAFFHHLFATNSNTVPPNPIRTDRLFNIDTRKREAFTRPCSCSNC